MPEGNAPVQVLHALPVSAQFSEELAEIVNALNEVLAKHNLWTEQVHTYSGGAYFVLLRTL